MLWVQDLGTFIINIRFYKWLRGRASWGFPVRTGLYRMILLGMAHVSH